MRAIPLMTPVVAVIVIAGYLLGSIPFGLLVANARGVDIRAAGSGNIGATNVWRVMGRTWGLLTFFCDAAKGWLAVFVAFKIAASWGWDLRGARDKVIGYEHLDPSYAGIAAALGCILGHNFPVWLKFKGGKGVATSLGVIFGMMPLASLIILAIWALVLKVSRYVSLASLIAAAALPVVVMILMTLWPAQWWGTVRGWGNFYFAVAAALLVWKRHVPNIKRLLAGTELRMGEKKPAPTAETQQ
jgi:glycerol-3-phosphate acyltransferase PlsY